VRTFAFIAVGFLHGYLNGMRWGLVWTDVAFPFYVMPILSVCFSTKGRIMTHSNIFGGLTLADITGNPNFKEDSVREEICMPILKRLGYRGKNITRSKILLTQVGRKKREMSIPDYILTIDGHNAFVLEAKAPNQDINEGDNVEQAFSYAIHNKVRSKYFALCNGKTFVVFKTNVNRTCVLSIPFDDIETRWKELARYLSIKSFHTGYRVKYHRESESFDYANISLLEEIVSKKQAAKRHFGCNAYFTRQTWNVVQTYIRNFTRKGDIVLDPFGGSGVTAVEALMCDRKAIHVDINPLSKFIAESLIAPVNLGELHTAFESVQKEYMRRVPKTETEIKAALQTYAGPKNLLLPQNADVPCVHQLFSEKQRAELSLLKSIIGKQRDVNIQKSLMLAFYNTVSVINKTFHETPQGGGNNFGYYYRYRVAPNPAIRNTIEVFEGKFKRIYDGKKELLDKINNRTVANAAIIKGTATDLSFQEDESVDYIYTDPPYGKNIAYLDLSIMWNAWLDLDVTEDDYALEAIEGGEHNKTKHEYKELIAQSIREMYRVLKYDRWLTFVFAHKDPEFWHLIIDTAEQCGFEYVGAVPQKNGQTSFKKRQNPFTVLSGQLMMNFRKVRHPKVVMNANFEMDVDVFIIKTIEEVIAKHYGATWEQINNYLIIQGMEKGFLDLLKKHGSDLTPLLERSFDYDFETEKWHIKKNVKFRTHVDVNIRIEYFLRSYLNRMEMENKAARFDDIVLSILPLLRNGTDPGKQTILGVLEDIAVPSGGDCWRLKTKQQRFRLEE